MQSIYNQDAESVRLLVQAGADVNRANRYGVTPLYLAARQGMEDIAILLLAAGANPHVRAADGETLLMTAAKSGSARLVRALLANDPDSMMLAIDPNLSESWKGQTALMWAAAEGHVEVMQALIEAGADINMRSAYIKVAEVDPDKRQGGFVYPSIPPGRMAALHFAARDGQLESARLLVEAGADLNIVDEQGSNALVLATLNGHFDVAALLLEAGADPNIRDRYGRSVLFVATDMNTLDANPRPGPRVRTEVRSTDIVRLALAKGADPNIALESRLPSWLAQGAGHNPMLDRGATPFFRAAMSGDLEIMQILLEAGADPNITTAERDTRNAPAFFGPPSGNTHPFLVSAGLGWREGTSRGREEDAIAAMSMFLNDFGADINQVNQAGDSAVHGAVIRGSETIIRFLAEQGADFSLINVRGYSALDLAHGQPEYRSDPVPHIISLLESLMTEDDHARIAERKAEHAARQNTGDMDAAVADAN